MSDVFNASAQPTPKAQWYSSPIIVGATLLCCGPIGIILTWVSPWKTGTKIGITVAWCTLAAITFTSKPPPRSSSSVASATTEDASANNTERGSTTNEGASPRPPQAEESKIFLGDSFRLGDFAYTIPSVKTTRFIGNQFVNERAGDGATFLLVNYAVLNLGDRTATAMADDFEIHDAQGRKFRPSSRGNTAFMMSGGDKDFILTELQPGIWKHSTQVFEIPAHSLDGATLHIPEKGLFGHKSVSVTLTTSQPKQKVKK